MSWENPTDEKNWKQAHLQIENIDLRDVERYSFLKPIAKDKFEVDEFIKLTN